MKKSLLLIALPIFAAFATAGAQSTGKSFYDTDQIQEVRIQFPFDNWAYLLDSLRFNGNGLLAGSVKIGGKTYDNVGIRYESDLPFTPGQKRNSLFIQLNFQDEEQNLEGHTSLHFSNALRDPSLVREVLGFEIARAYMPAPRANYAQIYINNAVYGLYINVETIDPSFLQNHFGSSDGPFFQARAHSQYDNFPETCKQRIYGSLEYESDPECYLYNFNQLSKGGWEDLIELTRVLNENPDDIESVLDVDRTLWMLAFNNVLVNLSSYTGHFSENFYLYRDSLGVFHPIIWDLNLCFGSFKNVGFGSDLRLKQLQEMDPYLHATNPYKPLINQLLKNETYRKVYLGHMRSIVFDFIENKKYEERAKQMQQLIQRSFVDDPNKFYRYEDFNVSLYTTIGKRSTIPGIVELMDARSDFLEKSTDLAVIPALVSEVKVLGREQFSSRPVDAFTITAKVEKFPKRVRVMYRFGEGSRFMEAPMNDDGKDGDVTANDGLYIASIKPVAGQTQIEYFIMAENASIMSFDPPDYMWNLRKISLEELNK
ncbi:MAG: CotH kinase family protein [Saprospirales bacterium]|nr:CotH kinase family protein [Saprospirales bacterium]